jgi:hypothetical protein
VNADGHDTAGISLYTVSPISEDPPNTDIGGIQLVVASVRF